MVSKASFISRNHSRVDEDCGKGDVQETNEWLRNQVTLYDWSLKTHRDMCHRRKSKVQLIFLASKWMRVQKDDDFLRSKESVQANFTPENSPFHLCVSPHISITYPWGNHWVMWNNLKWHTYRLRSPATWITKRSYQSSFAVLSQNQ